MSRFFQDFAPCPMRTLLIINCPREPVTCAALKRRGRGMPRGPVRRRPRFGPGCASRVARRGLPSNLRLLIAFETFCLVSGRRCYNAGLVSADLAASRRQGSLTIRGQTGLGCLRHAHRRQRLLTIARTSGVSIVVTCDNCDKSSPLRRVVDDRPLAVVNDCSQKRPHERMADVHDARQFRQFEPTAKSC